LFDGFPSTQHRPIGSTAPSTRSCSTTRCCRCRRGIARERLDEARLVVHRDWTRQQRGQHDAPINRCPPTGSDFARDFATRWRNCRSRHSCGTNATHVGVNSPGFCAMRCTATTPDCRAWRCTDCRTVPPDEILRHSPHRVDARTPEPSLQTERSASCAAAPALNASRSITASAIAVAPRLQ